MSTSKYKSNKTEDNRQNCLNNSIFRSSLPEVFFEEDVLKMCNKFTREHPYRSGISIKLLCNFTKMALRRGCSPVNLLHIFRTPFPKNASGGLPLYIFCISVICLFCTFMVNVSWVIAIKLKFLAIGSAPD